MFKALLEPGLPPQPALFHQQTFCNPDRRDKIFYDWYFVKEFDRENIASGTFLPPETGITHNREAVWIQSPKN